MLLRLRVGVGEFRSSESFLGDLGCGPNTHNVVVKVLRTASTNTSLIDDIDLVAEV